MDKAAVDRGADECTNETPSNKFFSWGYITKWEITVETNKGIWIIQSLLKCATIFWCLTNVDHIPEFHFGPCFHASSQFTLPRPFPYTGIRRLSEPGAPCSHSSTLAVTIRGLIKTPRPLPLITEPGIKVAVNTLRMVIQRRGKGLVWAWFGWMWVSLHVVASYIYSEWNTSLCTQPRILENLA